MEVERENVLATLDTLLEGDTPIAVVEGPSGRGKSVLLRQFAERHAERSVAVFISGESRWSYDIGEIRFDICNQLHLRLRGSELASFSDATDPLLGILLLEARRMAKRIRQPFLVVIDGLHEIPDQDIGSKRQIIELLPFGESSFRFVFSGDINELALRDKQRVQARPYLLTLFSLDETARFLSELRLTDADVADIYKITSGSPGFLASLRRLLEAGTSVKSVLADLPTRLPQPFDLEWRDVDQSDALQRKLLAILAHDLRVYTVEKLAATAGVESKAVLSSLSKLTFLTVGKDAGSEIRFVSDAFKRYAAGKLADEEDSVRQLLISALLRDPNAEETRDLLPRYLRDAGELEQLVSYLTLDYFAAFVRESSSLSRVQRSADLGIDAARALNRNGDLVRLTLQKATIADFDESSAGRAELRALAALGDHEIALAIAQGATRIEDRLLLLAALARSRREAKLPMLPEVEEQIVQLHENVDFGVLGDRAETLAADLLYSRPDLALKTIERSSATSATKASLQSNDWSYARLAVEARLVARDSGRPPEQIVEILDKIKNPKAKRLASHARVVFGELTAAEAIAEASRLSGVEDQVFVARQWVLSNRARADSGEVLEWALTAAIRATDYTPSAHHLRELATCLPYLTDEYAARRLIGILDGQASVARNVGPTEDYVRLQLILARAEWRLDSQAARNRIVDLYLFISGLADFSVKVVSTARFLAALSRLDPTKELEIREGLHSLAETEFREGIQVLLFNSADHYEATDSILSALAINRPDLALELVGQLNTEPRRDMAYNDIVETCITVPIEEIRFDIIATALQKIEDTDIRDEALVSLVASISDSPCGDEQLERLAGVLSSIPAIADPEDRARSASLAAAFLKRQKNPRWEALGEDLLRSAQVAWKSIDEAWTKVTVGFELVPNLAKEFPNAAREYLTLASQLRQQVALFSDASAKGVIWCLQLAIRGFAGLLPQNLATAAETERLEKAINRVPSTLARLTLWSGLAERYVVADRIPECRAIVETKIKPALADLESTVSLDFFNATTRCSASMYVGHAPTALAIIDKLPRAWRDEALFNIAEFIKRKCPLGDPFDPPAREGYPLSYNDAVDLCDLAERMDQDDSVYYLAEDIVDSLANPKTKVSRQQKGAIAQRLKQIADSKFPNPRYIKHEGWRIALRSQIARLAPPDRDGWKSLVTDSRKIPNAADRAYVLMIVASAMRDPRDRNPVIAEAVRALETIPMIVDKVDHYRMAGSLLVGVDSATSKEFLRKGLQYSLVGKGQNITASRREIVDMAYRIDPEFASKLASDIDDDPVKDRLKRRIALHELKKSMAQERPDFRAEDMEDFDYSRAAWMRLAALNAGRADHVPMETVLRYVDFAARQPLSRAYPIFALLIENATRRHARSDAARRSLSPLFEGALLGAELAIHASARAKAEKQAGLEVARERIVEQTIVVEPGEREKGMAYMARWLEKNAGSYVKISDPYFRPDDLEILRWVKSLKPNCSVSILTSKRAQQDASVPQPWDDTYNARWSAISDDSPPLTEIIIVGSLNNGTSPIHDRWLITSGSGLELGTSFGGIGEAKATSIRVMDEAEAESKERLLDDFVVHSVKDYGGQRYTYYTLVLEGS